MILQLGAFLGSLVSGIGTGLKQIITAAAPSALNIGQQFLQREINRKLATRQRRQVQAQAVMALNTPGISVARLGGTVQPVGGRVQRSTFTPAATTPAQSPFGNIPLLPVGGRLDRFAEQFSGPFISGLSAARRTTAMATNGFVGGGVRAPAAGLAPGEPKFARDEFGRTIMFVPSPRPGEGFITVAQARQLNLKPTRPFWRFNRKEGQFEKIKPRRLNPFNFRATSRAGRRVERSLDAVKELVRIERRQTTGKIRLKRSKKRKR